MRYYVRIFCNDTKVRTYGGSLEEIIDELDKFDFRKFNYRNNPIEWYDQWYNFIRSYITYDDLSKFMNINSRPITITYEIIKKRKSKKVIAVGKFVLENLLYLDRIRDELPISNYTQIQDIINELDNLSKQYSFKKLIIDRKIKYTNYGSLFKR